jgi:hypothetical protein
MLGQRKLHPMTPAATQISSLFEALNVVPDHYNQSGKRHRLSLLNALSVKPLLNKADSICLRLK